MRRTGRSNYILGILNGIFIRISYLLFQTNTLIPAFISHLTSSNILIGLASSIGTMGHVFPQVVVANLVEHRPRKKNVYVAMAWMRSLSMGLLAVFVFLADAGDRRFLLTVFFILFPIFALAGGIASVPFFDIVAKIVPSLQRSKFFSTRYFYGGILGILSGFFVVKPMLARCPFPRNYGIIFFFGFIFVTFALTVFSMVREPIHPVRKRRRGFADFLKLGLRFMKRDADYRDLVFLDIGLGFAKMSAPFYIIFALKVLMISEETVGTFIAAGMLGSILCNILWPRLAVRGGSRAVIRAAAFLTMPAPLLALIAAWFNFDNPVFFCILFFINGARVSGHGVGRNSYVLDISPPVDRPAYLSFLSAFTFPVMFFPMLGGAVINTTSFTFLFGVTLFVSALTFLLSLRLRRGSRAEREVVTSS